MPPKIPPVNDLYVAAIALFTKHSDRFYKVYYSLDELQDPTQSKILLGISLAFPNTAHTHYYLAINPSLKKWVLLMPDIPYWLEQEESQAVNGIMHTQKCKEQVKKTAEFLMAFMSGHLDAK